MLSFCLPIKIISVQISPMRSLKKEDFSPPRRKDRQDFLWTFSVLGVLSVLAVPFLVDSFFILHPS
jgi:hypothetical protein